MAKKSSAKRSKAMKASWARRKRVAKKSAKPTAKSKSGITASGISIDIRNEMTITDKVVRAEVDRLVDSFRANLYHKHGIK